MVAVIVSAVLVCAGALMLGQAVLRICGWQRWSWLAPAVGLVVQMLVAIVALHVPGRAATTAVLLALLAVASAIWVLRDPAMRPPIGGLLAAGPAAALAALPFAATGRAGTLGVSMNNDMASHLLWAESYASAAVAAVHPVHEHYPLGAHALVATIAQGIGAPIDIVFAGVTAATVVLLAWTALGVLGDRVGWPGRVVVATVGAMPFLVAGYYGQGSFKELMQALFVLGVVVALVDRGARPALLRWAPLALLAVGTVSVYSVLGLPWIIGIAGATVAVALIRRAAAGSPRDAVADVRAAIGPALAACAVLLVAIATQIPRIERFLSHSFATTGTATGIPKENIGNLAGRLPLWEAFATWDNPDYRFGAIDPFTTGMWTAFVLALALFGIVWCARRGEWVLPLAALVAFAIWVLSDRSQSPYVAAKALLILAPLIVLLAVRPLVEHDGSASRQYRLAATALALLLAFKVVDSSQQALRAANVAPRTHVEELRSLRPMLDRRPTLFLGNDDFIESELAGVPALAPVIGIPRLLHNPAKPWAYGEALDIDSLEAKTINEFDWVIATRDAADSEMPPQLRRVRQTRNYELWRRTGVVEPRGVLAEGGLAAAKLDCSTPAGRRIVRAGGVARVRPAPIIAGYPAFAAGTSIGFDVALGPGTYDLALDYLSPQPIELEVVGHLKTRMAASLERPGPRWPIGRVTIGAGSKRLVRVGMYAHRTRLTWPGVAVPGGRLFATPAGEARTVPIRTACGKLVDYYEASPR